MLTTGNAKLGPTILSWSLPAVSTCPGATESCREACYASSGHYTRPAVAAAMRVREKASRRKRFVDRIVSEVESSTRTVVRVHASGDFYSAEYADAWREIAGRCPAKIFFAYTRSWRVPEIAKSLREFAKLPNVRLWLSCDRETGCPPRKFGSARRAYMATSDADRPVFAVDLVFRVDRKSVRKFWADGALVCPAENGVTSTTCGKCRLCWSACRIPRQDRSV